MDICLFLVWLICFFHTTYTQLLESYEERKVFVGADLKMRCDGPPTSGNLIMIEWRLISGDKETGIFFCSSDTHGSCEDIGGHILDDNKKYTSTFTVENVSHANAGKYVCEIHTSRLQKSCRFIVTIKEQPPVGLTLINESERSTINSSFLRVRADANTTITCRANTSVYLQWYPNCSNLSSHACHESNQPNSSRALSFTPRASQNGTILTCRIENIDKVSITLQVEVCVKHLEIVRNDSFESTVGGESAWRCQTNTSNFNLTSSSPFFNTSYLEGRGNKHTTASWENVGALHLASFKLDSNVSSLSCCVSKTSLCPEVCSEEYFNVLNGSTDLASTDHPEITTLANTNGFPAMVSLALYAVGATVFLITIVIVFILVFRRWRKKNNGRVPGELDNIQGPGTQLTGNDRGALPPIPTITADPAISYLPVPSHVAQTNRRMARGSQDRIPLQSLVSPVDDTLERDQNRIMGARPNAGTSVKTVPVNPDVEYAVVNKKPRSGKCRADKHKLDPDISLALRGPLDPSVEYATVDKQRNITSNLGSSSAQTGQAVQPEQSLRKKIGSGGNIPHVYTASASGLAEYAVVDTTREERKKGQLRAHERNMAYHNPQVKYAVVDKTQKSRREK